MQTRIVHLIRHSLRYVPRCSYDHVAEELRPISKAAHTCAGLAALEAFEERRSEQPVSASHNSWKEGRT